MSTEARGKIWVAAHYGRTTEDSETPLEVRAFETTAVARVHAQYGATLNLGNYQSARVDCGVDLPCYPEEVAPAFAAAWALVMAEIKAQVARLKNKPEAS